MQKKPLILHVENNPLFLATFRASMFDDVEVIDAPTFEQAEGLFLSHRGNIDLIIMDSSLGGARIDTLPLVRRIRNEGYDGPMLTSSISHENQQTFLQAGCSHTVGAKEYLDKVARRILRESGKL